MNSKDNQDCYAYKEITENPIKLDFTGTKYFKDIHKIFKEKFGLPEYYGENPDALWDLLANLFDKETTAEIYGYQTLSKEAKETLDELICVLKDVQASSPYFTFKIIS